MKFAEPPVHFDASSCYNRIHCFLANLVSRKYGVDKLICIVQGRTLAEAKCCLRTKLGVSEGFILPIPSTALDKEVGILQYTGCSSPEPSLIAMLSKPMEPDFALQTNPSQWIST